MKNRVTQLSHGSIAIKKPDIRFSVERLDGIVVPDKIMTVTVDMTSQNRVPIQAFFYSTNPRVRVSKNVSVVSAGRMNIEVDSNGLTVSDEIRGSVDIVYNGGEASIPYCFAVGLMGSVKRFRSLQEFSEYATAHFDEAVNIFSWKDFLMMPFMHDLRLTGLYRTYESSVKPDGGMTEFLKAAGAPLPEAPSETGKEPAPRKKLIRSEEAIALETRYRIAELFLEAGKRDHLNRTLLPVRKEIASLKKTAPDDIDLGLLYAYVLFLDQDMEGAKDELLKIQDTVQKEKTQNRDRYGAFLYLSGAVKNDGERIAKATKTVHKYWQEGSTSFLMAFLEYKLNEDCKEDPAAAAEFLWQIYQRGMKYTAVLQETAILWDEKNVSVDRLTEYELRTLFYGIRNGLVSEKKLFEVLSSPLRDPSLLNLYIQTLKAGYRRFGNIELLHALINVYLQKKCVGTRYFEWYREAVDQKLTVRGLYEYYMASLPRSIDRKLPEQLVAYFGYQKEITGIPLTILYDNVLTYYQDDPDIMELYRDKIDRYALRAADDETYSVRMRSMFERVLRPENVNERTSTGLLKLFYLREIETDLTGMKRVVLHYPEFDKEDSYELEEDGRKAVAPVFSDETIICFENEKGERFCDPNVLVTELFPESDLKKQCALYAEESLLFKLNDANTILRSGVLKDTELMLVTELINDKRIAPFYRTKLYEAVIDLSVSPSMRHIDCSSFLAEADFRSFTREYRRKLLSALIDRSKNDIALDRILNYGGVGLDDERLLKLMESAITYQVMDGNEVILAYCYRLYSHDTASSSILEFLAKHFNGSAEDMTGIVRAIRKKKLPSYDLIGRTMMTCFYTGSEKDLDMLFDWYLGEDDRNETIIRAYLVLRCHESFMEKRKLTDSAVSELKKRVFQLPRIGFLALSKYYAEHVDRLTDEEKKQVAELVNAGVEENVVPASFETLAPVAGSVFELENRVFVELTDPSLSHVFVYGQRFPDNGVFHREMQEIYPGAFVQSFLLFGGEWIQYTFFAPDEEGNEKEIAGGVLSRPAEAKRKNTLYGEILHVEKKIADPDAREAAESLKSLIVKEELADEIFRRDSENGRN